MIVDAGWTLITTPVVLWLGTPGSHPLPAPPSSPLDSSFPPTRPSVWYCSMLLKMQVKFKFQHINKTSAFREIERVWPRIYFKQNTREIISKIQFCYTGNLIKEIKFPEADLSKSAIWLIKLCVSHGYYLSPNTINSQALFCKPLAICYLTKSQLSLLITVVFL